MYRICEVNRIVQLSVLINNIWKACGRQQIGTYIWLETVLVIILESSWQVWLIIETVPRICNCRLSEGEYDEIADETLESLSDKFDALVEDGVTSQDYDVQFAVCIYICICTVDLTTNSMHNADIKKTTFVVCWFSKDVALRVALNLPKLLKNKFGSWGESRSLPFPPLC